MKKKEISRERKRQIRRNALGYCFRAACNRKINRWGLCRKHANEDSERRKAKYQAKKKEAAR